MFFIKIHPYIINVWNSFCDYIPQDQNNIVNDEISYEIINEFITNIIDNLQKYTSFEYDFYYWSLFLHTDSFRH